MRAILSLAALFAATSAQAQDVQELGEWMLQAKPTSCSLGTNSGDTVLAFVVNKADTPGTLRLTNAAWTLEGGKEYPAQLSFSSTAGQDKVTLRAAQSASGQRALMGSLTASVAESFKASDMLSMEIEGIDEFISVNITDGPRIWAAMEACMAKLPR